MSNLACFENGVHKGVLWSSWNGFNKCNYVLLLNTCCYRWTPFNNAWRTCWAASPSTGTSSTRATRLLAKGPGYYRYKYWRVRTNIGVQTLPQDGTYSFADFCAAFEEYDVQRVVRSYENSISISVHCCQEGDWSQVIHHSSSFQTFMKTNPQQSVVQILANLCSGQGQHEYLMQRFFYFKRNGILEIFGHKKDTINQRTKTQHRKKKCS